MVIRVSKTSDMGDILPSESDIDRARSKIYRSIPQDGIRLEEVTQHLENDLVPGFNKASRSPNYYGFVTGGATPAATFADHLAVDHDQSVQVHLPKDSIATDVEDAALRMFCELVDLKPDQWPHRTFTTGATASNIVGLACGREYVIQEAARRKGLPSATSIAEDGIIEAMRKADIDRIQILTTVPHSSLRKAASIIGLGRSCVVDLGQAIARHHFALQAVEEALSKPRTASIIAVSAAEVNTGFFATSGNDMRQLREMADRHGAWIHVDAAFGLQARCLPTDGKDVMLDALIDGVRDLDLADSITADAHKLLNVPYDCGVFLSKHLELGTWVFQNVGAVYLSVSSASAIPSPLNIGIENSRRFRALPVYSSLLSLGRTGHRDMLLRQIDLARAIYNFLSNEPGYRVLPILPPSFEKPKEQGVGQIYIVVLFRATDDVVNRELVQRINATRKIYVSGTQWDGQPAARFAVSNWQVDVERDIALIKDVLKSVLQ